MKPPPPILLMIDIGMMLVALLAMPYGYYQLLRLVTVVTAGWAAAYFWQTDRQSIGVLAGVVALLFNPLIPVALDRSTWSIINLIVAGLLAVMAFLLRPTSDVSRA